MILRRIYCLLLLALTIATIPISSHAQPLAPSASGSRTANGLMAMGSEYDQQRKSTVSTYLDKTRVLSEGDVRRVWIMFDFDRPQEERIGYRYLSILHLTEIQCAQSVWRNIEEQVFAGPMASGQMVKRNVTPPRATSRSTTVFSASTTPTHISGQSATKNFGGDESYRPVAPNSLQERIFKQVCR